MAMSPNAEKSADILISAQGSYSANTVGRLGKLGLDFLESECKHQLTLISAQGCQFTAGWGLDFLESLFLCWTHSHAL